jgi:uncharacterized membrane protein
VDPYIGDWLNLIVRWTHVITGIAWIGSSFFFIWLDAHLESPGAGKKGISGELWMVHSGGFYEVNKITVAPAAMPRTLHWFKWEAGFAWVTGMLLLALLYYVGADIYMVEAGGGGPSPTLAITLGLGAIVLSWVVYDALWASPFGKTGHAPAIVSWALLAALAYGLGQLLPGRAAFIHVGAALGTVMAANVWMRIIPAQRQLVKARTDGVEPDATLGARAKQRSVHNNYMTLPVVFVMLSSHYPATFGHPYNWLVLLALFAIGAVVRHVFNLRNAGKAGKGWWFMGAAAATMAVLVVLARPAGFDDAGADVSFADVRLVIQAHCLACHAATPTHEAFDEPPKGVVFETPRQIKQRAPLIHALTVASKAMPLGNETQMTDAERALLGSWVKAGAPIDE